LDEAAFKEADLLVNLQSTLAIARPELRHRITLIVDADGLPPIRCYPAELNQVFLNLIVNAAQAMPEQGTLTIRGRDTGTAIELAFQDTGMGMPPDVIARCFDPFFTTKPVGSGTGLGLSLAYTIITDRHKGSIRAESVIGVGTTITILLPKEIQP
jgi:signal transduction histidine kinase